MAYERIKVDYEQGQADPAAVAEIAKRVRDGLALLIPKGADKAMPAFDGPGLNTLQNELRNLSAILIEYNQLVVAVDAGAGPSRFKVGDTIQTLDKGARESAGKIVEFLQDGTVAKYLKSNGTHGSVAVTYMKQF